MTIHSPIHIGDEAAVLMPIRVMLIDDSVVVRSIFARVLGQSPEIEIVAEAGNCAEALALLSQNQVDIILLDIEMPDRTGLDALPDILAVSQGARVMVVSAFAEENGAAAIQALSLGACDTLAKPGRFGFNGKFPEVLVDKVVRLGRTTRPARDGTVPGYCSSARPEARAMQEVDCIAIGASTGGIPVIYDIARSLPATLDCPIFITQHLPQAFIEFFAQQLQAQTTRKVRVPSAGEPIEAGVIYVSPGDRHLVCRRQGERVVADHLGQFRHSRYSPSVDALFVSVADCYGENVIAIVLSGMGNDGAAGAAALASRNARILVQDARSSVVWGMPGAIARAGHASAILSPPQLISFIARSAGQ